MVTDINGDRATARVTLDLRLPAGLREDRLARSPETAACPVTVTITLDAGARHVDVTVTVDNRARDHRLRVLCETGTRTLNHVAGTAFAWIERPNRLPVARGWVEPPTPDRCAQDLVAVTGASRGLALGLDGLRDYAVATDGATIAVTLLRAIGWLSRGDLRARRGHAGPALETPSAQCLGPRDYRYLVVPFAGGRAALPGAARVIHAALAAPWLGRGRGERRSMCALEGDPAVALTALRGGPGGQLVARLANPDRSAAKATLRFLRPVVAARAVDLREGDLTLGNTGVDPLRTAPPPVVADGAVVVRLAPYEIGTFLVTLEPPVPA